MATYVASGALDVGITGRDLLLDVHPKTLHVIDAENDVEFFFLRPRDIATYVASGALDVGITGRDLLLDV
ncbi:ATP phosphoribosyltransferase, partial [Methylobacterium radiotolerans]